MDAAKQLPDHLDLTGARPVIAGTDIKVSQIAAEHEHAGMSPDEIVDAHPHITLADVHAALAYYFDHPTLIQADWAETDALAASLRKQYPSRE